MTVQIEETEHCKVKVNYVAEPDLVEEKKQEAVARLKRAKVRIPGFRQGKATDLAIRLHMSAQIEQMVTQELVSEAYDEALFETQMKPIGRPQVTSHKLEGKRFECEMMVNKKPDFELGQYTGFEIPQPHLDEDATQKAEEMMQQLRLSYAGVAVYEDDDFVQEGDQVTLSTKVSVDDKDLPEMSQDGVLYQVGQGMQVIPEFDSGLYGMKAGDTKEFFVTVAEDDERFLEEVRGKQVKFEVTVHMGTKKVPAALDDELAKQVGFETYDELRNHVQGTASSQIENKRKRKIQDQIMARILEAHDIEVPDWMVLNSAKLDAQSKGLNWDDLSDEQIDVMLDNHERDVRLSLILDAIREEEPESSYSDEELIEKLRDKITEQGRDPNQLIQGAAQSGYLMGILAALKDELTMDWLQRQSSLISEEDTETEEKVESEDE